MKKLNQILDKILKRILMTPEATPREALYIETGLLDVETIIDLKRLNMMARLNREKSELMAAILANPNCKWMKRTKEVMQKYNIDESELQGSKSKSREAIIHGIHMKMYANVRAASEGRSKLSFFLNGKTTWTAESPAPYMKDLTRKQASTIFKARTRMTKVKGNYKNGYPDQTCRACKQNDETQQHALNECTVLNTDPSASTTNRNVFCTDTDALRNMAKEIDKICEILNEVN